MDQPPIPIQGVREPDAYARVTLHGRLVPDAVRVHLLWQLIQSLGWEQKQALREACEDCDDWGRP
jgi:hypothetical protein